MALMPMFWGRDAILDVENAINSRKLESVATEGGAELDNEDADGRKASIQAGGQKFGACVKK